MVKLRKLSLQSRRFILFVFFAAFILIQDSKIYAQAKYRSIHESAIVVDTHTDAIWNHMQGDNIEQLSTKNQVDLVRLKEGGVDVQFFALWPNPRTHSADQMFDHTMELTDSMTAIIKRNPDKIRLCTSVADIEAAIVDDRISGMLGIEGGTAIENSIKNLDIFYEKGVRYLGLTWNDSPDWASSAEDEVDRDWNGHRGLNDFGHKVIRRMNELGMIIDLSHSGEQTFYDVLEVSSKPVVCTHSCASAICQHYRNLTDDQLTALAKNGGVVFVNFWSGYLVNDFDKIYGQAKRKATQIQDSLKEAGSNENFDRSTYIHKFIDPIFPSVANVADQIDYMVNLIGEDYVGIGADYDGIPFGPAGLEDVSKMPNLTKELLRRGYSKKSINKILGGNFMRVFAEISDTGFTTN